MAWQNLDLYSAAELDELPVDLVQRLLDKSVEARKLTLAILHKFAQQPIYHLDLTSVNDVNDEWLLATRGFALHHLSLAFCSAVRPGSSAGVVPGASGLRAGTRCTARVRDLCCSVSWSAHEMGALALQQPDLLSPGAAYR